MAYCAVLQPDHGKCELWPMSTRNVVLTEHQEELIDTLVRSGRYQNANEVLREGLRLVERREAEDAARLAALREAAAVGFAALIAVSSKRLAAPTTFGRI
jgi:putative addiction module CopG family antidote